MGPSVVSSGFTEAGNRSAHAFWVHTLLEGKRDDNGGSKRKKRLQAIGKQKTQRGWLVEGCPKVLSWHSINTKPTGSSAIE